MKRQPTIFLKTKKFEQEQKIEICGFVVMRKTNTVRNEQTIVSGGFQTPTQQKPESKSTGSTLLKSVLWGIVLVIVFLALYPIFSHFVAKFLSWYAATIGLKLTADLINLAIDKLFDIIVKIFKQD